MSNRTELERQSLVKVEISPEIMEAIEGCRDTSNGNHGRVFTPEEDAAILKYYNVKRKEDLARVFDVCAETLRKRYNKLTEQESVI